MGGMMTFMKDGGNHPTNRFDRHDQRRSLRSHSATRCTWFPRRNVHPVCRCFGVAQLCLPPSSFCLRSRDRRNVCLPRGKFGGLVGRVALSPVRLLLAWTLAQEETLLLSLAIPGFRRVRYLRPGHSESSGCSGGQGQRYHCLRMDSPSSSKSDTGRYYEIHGAPLCTLCTNSTSDKGGKRISAELELRTHSYTRTPQRRSNGGGYPLPQAVRCGPPTSKPQRFSTVHH